MRSLIVYYVYQICARDDGRVVYIGMGKRHRCFQRHRKNPDINALTAAGGAFKPEPIAGPMSQAEAWAEEIRQIATHKRVCDGGTLLNRSVGGPGCPGFERSAAYRAKLSASHRGKKQSPEAIAKRAATMAAKRSVKIAARDAHKAAVLAEKAAKRAAADGEKKAAKRKSVPAHDDLKENALAVAQLMAQHGLTYATCAAALEQSERTVRTWFRPETDKLARLCPQWAPLLLRYVVNEPAEPYGAVIRPDPSTWATPAGEAVQ
jgi:hypothetical protein